MEELVYTPKEVQKLLKLGRTTTYEALRTGVIPSIRIGSKYLVPASAIRQLLDEVKN